MWVPRLLLDPSLLPRLKLRGRRPANVAGTGNPEIGTGTKNGGTSEESVSFEKRKSVALGERCSPKARGIAPEDG